MEKVGCTSRFEERMKEQGFEPLEEYIKSRHTSIEEASLAEETLRKFYGYKKDSPMTYLEKFRKPTIDGITKVWKQSHYVGWNELKKGASKDDLLESLSKHISVTLVTKGGSWKFSMGEYEALAKAAFVSQHRDFYWSTKILNNMKNEKEETTTGGSNNPCTHGSTIPEFERVRKWATDRGLYKGGDPKTQMLKLMEEVGETSKAILKQDEPEIVDGLGDILVVLINLTHLAGYRLEDCLEGVLEIIEKRTGKMKNGTFVKDES